MRRVEFHEITKKGVQHGVENPRDARQAPLRRAARPPRARPHRRLRRLGARSGTSSRSASRPGACSRSRCGSSSTASGRSRRSSRRSTGTSRVALTRQGARQRFVARLAKADGEKLEVKNGEQAAGVRADLESAGYRVAEASRSASRSATRPRRTPRASSSRTPRATCTSRPSARCSIAQALYEGIDLKQDGGLVGLITYMRTDSTCASAPTRSPRCATTSQKTYGEEFVPAQAERLQVEEERAGGARGDPPDLARAHARDGEEVPHRRAVQALQADLGSLRRVADDAGRLRSDDGVDIEATPSSRRRRYRTLSLRASGKVLKFAGWLEQ